MNNTAKLTVTESPVKTDKAWLIKLNDQAEPEYWIPKFYIAGYKPWIKEIEIETFILIDKGIKFKV